jgi:hypothetical protein
MRLIACHCHGCDRYWLHSREELERENIAACECGRSARVLPGQSYIQSDMPLFEAIASSLQAARVTPMQAGRLGIELEGCDGMPANIKLARLTQLVPSLAIIELIATTDVATTRKAVGMFAMLFEAIATARSKSDVSALLSEPPLKRQSLP